MPYEYDPRRIDAVKVPVVKDRATGELVLHIHLFDEAGKPLRSAFLVPYSAIVHRRFMFNKGSLNRFERDQLKNGMLRLGSYDAHTFQLAIDEAEANLPCELIMDDGRRLVMLRSHMRQLEGSFERIKEKFEGLRPTADKPTFKLDPPTIGEPGDTRAPE